jgi:hypothetical protein
VPEDEAHRDIKSRLLTILVHDPDPATLAKLGAHIEKDPEILDANALIRLDERGLPQAEKRLVAMVKEHPDWPSRVYPAARLAMKGNDVGRALLAATAKKSGMLKTMPDTFLAASAALTFLGDAAAWKHALALGRDAVKKAADAGQIPYASWLLLRLEYFHRAGAKKQPVALAFMSGPVEKWSREHADGLDTADAILARLAAL